MIISLPNIDIVSIEKMKEVSYMKYKLKTPSTMLAAG